MRPQTNLLFDIHPDDLFSECERVESVSETFRRLYYYLYTNSEFSRAERIAADLSLILLLKLATETNGDASVLTRFAEGGGKANSLLIPFLRESYPQLIDAHDRFGLGDAALRDCLSILRPVSLRSSPAHVLGDAFQALIGPRLRGERGQFFTPRSLARAMVRIIDPAPQESVLDPACGTGGFLMESHIYQTAKSGNNEFGQIVGVDKDHDLYRICSALLNITCGRRAQLYNANSLDVFTSTGNELARQQFDVILTNPPFGARIGLKDKTILRRFDLAHQWNERQHGNRWRLTDIVLSTQDPQILFLELCVRKLKPGGRLGIVLPEGVFGNKRSGFVWEWVRSQGRITALVDCPRTTFQPGTDTKTNVLFFEKSRSPDGARRSDQEQVYVAVPLRCGHDRRGRTHYSNGKPYPDDFEELGNPQQSAKAGWRKVEITNKDYVVPRYYVDEPRSTHEEALVKGAERVSLATCVREGYISIRKGNEVGSDAYGTGDIPFVRTSDITNFEVSVDPTKAVSDAVYAQYASQQQLRPGDILMVVDGRYRIGATALLTESNHRCIVQSHFRIISISGKSPVDAYEFMFALNLPSVKMRLRNLVFVQSTLGTLGKRLLELEIPLLHGEGPWHERVAQFRESLRQRDDSLSRLRHMTASECEL